MTKDQNILNKRSKDVYDEVKQAKRDGEKVLYAIITFSERHYLSVHTVWKDYYRAIATYGKIDFY